jgi:MFS family permease
MTLPREGAGRGALRLVAAVACLNLLSYVDRQLLVALAPLLMADLGLSRAGIGLLIGVSFISVFAVGTLVVGALADRWHRPYLLAAGLAVWSVATALTATAGGAASLAAWRALVGIGEAALPATALAMLGDRVPPRHLGLANGVFYAGIPLGFALSFVLAGLIGPWLGWRACFAVLGSLGLVVVVLILRLQDPPRRGAPVPAASAAAAARAAIGALAGRPVLLVLMFAGALLAYASASSQHAITWLVEERGFAYPRAALLSAIVIGSAGLGGNLAFGALTDRAHRRHPAGRLLAFALLSAGGLGAAVGFYSLPPTSILFFPAWVVAQAWLLGWYGPLVAAIDERAPAGGRATVIGLTLLLVNLLGVATGPFVTGLIGDRAGLTRGLLASLAPAAVGASLVLVVGLRELVAHRHATSS